MTLSWPDNDQPLEGVQSLIDPFVEAVQHCYAISLKSGFPYSRHPSLSALRRTLRTAVNYGIKIGKISLHNPNFETLRTARRANMDADADFLKGLEDKLQSRYALKRQNEAADVPYKGYDISDGMVQKDLTAETFAYAASDKKSPLHVILNMVVQLGVEQGQRLEKASGRWKKERKRADAIHEEVEKMLASMTPKERREFDDYCNRQTLEPADNTSNTATQPLPEPDQPK